MTPVDFPLTHARSRADVVACLPMPAQRPASSAASLQAATEALLLRRHRRRRGEANENVCAP